MPRSRALPPSQQVHAAAPPPLGVQGSAGVAAQRRRFCERCLVHTRPRAGTRPAAPPRVTPAALRGSGSVAARGSSRRVALRAGQACQAQRRWLSDDASSSLSGASPPQHCCVGARAHGPAGRSAPRSGRLRSDAFAPLQRSISAPRWGLSALRAACAARRALPASAWRTDGRWRMACGL